MAFENMKTEHLVMANQGYKLIQVTKLGEIRETTASGWNAEHMMDMYYRQIKEDKNTHYVVLFYVGGSIRAEYRAPDS